MNKYLAIIPARAGSKRLPKKNVLNFSGKPLISWSIDAAKDSANIDNVLVTSDDEEVLTIAKEHGVHIIKRPKELSSDTSAGIDAVIHAVNNFDKYEYIVLLQPTSPLRTSKHIYEAIQFLESNKADAVISVCEVEHSPLWSNTLPQNLSMVGFIKDEVKNLRSQDLSTYYRLNGAIYICKTEILLKQKSFFIDDNIYAYKMKKEDSIDIDTRLDFLIARTILEEKSNGF